MAKATVNNPETSRPAAPRAVGCASVDALPGQLSSVASTRARWLPDLWRTTVAARGTWGLVDQAVVSASSFLAAAAVGRFAGADQFGIYSLAVSIFWLVAGIPNALVWTPYTSRAPRLTAGRRRTYSGSGLVHLIVVGAVIAAVLLILGLSPLPGLSDETWFLPMCLALIPFTLLMTLREHLRRLLFAHMNTRGLLLVDLPIALGQIIALLGLARAEKLSFTTALLGMSLPCGWCIVWLVRHRQRFRFDLRRIRLHWSYNFHFGRWLLVVSIAWLLGDGLLRWLLGALHGLSALGLFAAAMTTVMFVSPIMLATQNLVRSVLSNSFAEGGIESLRKNTRRSAGQVAAGFGIVLLLLAVFGGRLVELLFGSEFTGLGVVVASLCLGMYLHVLTIPVDGALAALQDGRALLIASLVRLGLIVGVGFALIAVYGPMGVGLTMAVSSCGAAVTQWAFFRRRCCDVG